MKGLWNRFCYRHWARLLHALNLHHSRRYGPMEDGSILERCEWCGLSRVVYRPGWKRVSIDSSSDESWRQFCGRKQ